MQSSFDTDAREVRPQAQIDFWEAPGERAYVWFVHLHESSSHVFLQVGGVLGDIHPFLDPFVDKRIQAEEAVCAGELRGGIGPASLVLEDEDLLGGEARCPRAKRIAIEPSLERILICL